MKPRGWMFGRPEAARVRASAPAKPGALRDQGRLLLRGGPGHVGPTCLHEPCAHTCVRTPSSTDTSLHNRKVGGGGSRTGWTERSAVPSRCKTKRHGWGPGKQCPAEQELLTRGR